jgi:hypothetical protein
MCNQKMELQSTFYSFIFLPYRFSPFSENRLHVALTSRHLHFTRSWCHSHTIAPLPPAWSNYLFIYEFRFFPTTGNVTIWYGTREIHRVRHPRTLWCNTTNLRVRLLKTHLTLSIYQRLHLLSNKSKVVGLHVTKAYGVEIKLHSP